MKKATYIKILAFLCLLCFELSLMSAAYAASARLLFTGVPGQIEVGERFFATVKVESAVQSINAVSGTISFPENLLRIVSISKEKSIVNLWIATPVATRNEIPFEGVILNGNPAGAGGTVFEVTFEAKKPGNGSLGMSEGAVLANDGQGSNILSVLDSAKFSVIPVSRNQDPSETSEILAPAVAVAKPPVLPILPIITKYSVSVEPNSMGYVAGKGEPGALTRLVFRDISFKSAGERFINFLQAKKIKLEEVVVQNDTSGRFLYVSPDNLVAGTYNIIPFLVGEGKDAGQPGRGVDFLVKESMIIHALIVLINVLVLLIPVVSLTLIIYFIPWYSFKRMRVLRKKLVFEEEKIESSEHALKHSEQVLNAQADTAVPLRESH